MDDNYQDKYGAWHGGKGSRYRPLDVERYRSNYDDIDWEDASEEEVEEDEDE